MPLPDYVLKQIKCCLSQDEHIIVEPAKLKCGGNACKECIKSYHFKCENCSIKHDKDDFVECKSTESLIRFVMSDLSQSLDEKLCSIKSLSTGYILFVFIFFNVDFETFIINRRKYTG